MSIVVRESPPVAEETKDRLPEVIEGATPRGPLWGPPSSGTFERMDQMGEYLVRRLIGEGGMGKVYEAEERLSKRRVALKVLHPELAKSEQARKLFLNEMQILANLEHPNVVRMLASLEVGGELAMVLEYLDGKTLRQVIGDRGRLPWGSAVAVIASTAHALSSAHGREPPIIHRDLKPENIMVLSDGSIKVMDFGIAKVIEAMNQTNTQSVGTLQYMSPEQIDAHTIDHRSDLYCLGLILYELLEGKPPFTSNSPRQLLNLQCTADPPALSSAVRENIPRGVEELLFQLLEKAPEDRPYLSEDVVERLEPFLPAGGTGLGDRPSDGKGRSHTRLPVSPRGSSPSGPGSLDTPQARRASFPQPARVSAEPGRLSGEPNQSVKAASVEGSMTPAARASDVPRVAVERADTIALIERGEKPREVSNAIAIAIVVALSLLAGIAAYAVRASSAPSDKAAPASTDKSDKKAGSKASPGSGW
jgi:eukaryotic-like serine/threonine-protein kinase